jgi:hypothetical protein
MTDSQNSSVRRLVWRDHAKGPGVATFEYADGGHDHRPMSQYEARTLAADHGLVLSHQDDAVHEWNRT